MSLAIDVATEGVRIPVARARVAALAEGVLRRERVAAAMLTIAYVTDRRNAEEELEKLPPSLDEVVTAPAEGPAGSGA